ncbi:MurR/RpiR family transcriptional regulator [Lacticaseibacillus sharpeae]|uniref:MurR/RpiR family transcriptional regulator n=1 Tax=Lacticaseibacillus sharpeae TaxID=1626 RepID=UPI0009EB11FD
MLLTDKLQQTDNFTDNEQRIATYIAGNMDAVATMAIQELAAATYTSHSAIVRFAKTLATRATASCARPLWRQCTKTWRRSPTWTRTSPSAPETRPWTSPATWPS